MIDEVETTARSPVVRAPSAPRTTLPPDLVTAGVRRLRIASVLSLAINVVFAAVDVLAPPPVAMPGA